MLTVILSTVRKFAPNAEYHCFRLCLSFLKKLYSSLVDLQYCANFCCTTKWLSYTYFFTFLCIMVYHKILNTIPCAIQQGLVVYLCYMQQFLSANPKPLVYPS